MTTAATGAGAFAASLAGPAAAFRYDAVNASWLRAECETGLAAASRLRSYRDFLATARTYKAAGGAGDVDAQALAEARRAAGDLHALAASALAATGALLHCGELDRHAAAWRAAVDATGGITLGDLWRHATGTPSRRDLIRSAGVDDALFAALDETVTSLDAHLSAQDRGIVLTGTVAGSRVQATLVTTPRLPQATSVSDLFMRGRFNALSAALGRDEPAYLYGMPLRHDDVHAEDVALFGALAAAREGVRHLRKLEDTGLETYAGGDPGTAITVIVIASLALLITGDILRAIYCPQGDDLHTLDSGPTGCVIAKIIIMIATVGLLFGFADTANKIGPSMTPTGSVVMKGELTDLAVRNRPVAA